MCTAIVYGEKNRFFGRNLDLERVYDEQVVVTPRHFEFTYKNKPVDKSHYAMIGMATVAQGYPLYYEATNECGLSMAGLNFVGNCAYAHITLDMCENLAQYELIPYVLGRCGSVEAARKILLELNLVDEKFSDDFALPELHWMIADSQECIVLEVTHNGVQIYDNPVGVLTNNPPFDFQMQNLNMYLNLTAREPPDRFSDRISLVAFSRGMGALGLPGDTSSVSRFVRTSFVKLNALDLSNNSDGRQSRAVSQFFHILSSAEMVEGCVAIGDKYERTQYSCCCDTRLGIYYYRTYECTDIRSVDMYAYDIDGSCLIRITL